MSRASDAPVVDWGDHGTVVSSIVAKYAPEAEITLYKECEADTQNNSPYPQIVAGLMAVGIYRAVHDGADVINISAGAKVYFDVLREACQDSSELKTFSRCGWSWRIVPPALTQRRKSSWTLF